MSLPCLKRGADPATVLHGSTLRALYLLDGTWHGVEGMPYDQEWAADPEHRASPRP